MINHNQCHEQVGKTHTTKFDNKINYIDTAINNKIVWLPTVFFQAPTNNNNSSRNYFSIVTDELPFTITWQFNSRNLNIIPFNKTPLFRYLMDFNALSVQTLFSGREHWKFENLKFWPSVCPHAAALRAIEWALIISNAGVFF